MKILYPVIYLRVNVVIYWVVVGVIVGSAVELPPRGLMRDLLQWWGEGKWGELVVRVPHSGRTCSLWVLNTTDLARGVVPKLVLIGMK